LCNKVYTCAGIVGCLLLHWGSVALVEELVVGLERGAALPAPPQVRPLACLWMTEGVLPIGWLVDEVELHVLLCLPRSS
jgi:hypothetical protein